MSNIIDDRYPAPIHPPPTTTLPAIPGGPPTILQRRGTFRNLRPLYIETSHHGVNQRRRGHTVTSFEEPDHDKKPTGNRAAKGSLAVSVCHRRAHSMATVNEVVNAWRDQIPKKWGGNLVMDDLIKRSQDAKEALRVLAEEEMREKYWAENSGKMKKGTLVNGKFVYVHVEDPEDTTS